ncbi:MAG: hypothetical protein Q8N85_01185 [Candidatus Omnitrophota bacterium]|nr:hypothetical protein [Candidatus Omnitrophota bacterium]
MVRTVDSETRSRAVLAAAINRYIKNALPVSSEDLSGDFELSSATIRNIFADLENEGLLAHRHTSGGRVPTERGFRYYVDFLISQMELIDEEKESIVRKFRREIRRLDDALEATSEVISAITHYAGIVSFTEWEDKFLYRGISRILEQPEFQDMGKLRLVIGLIEDKQRLLGIINREFSGKVKIYIGKELEYPEMEHCSLVVSGYRRKNKPSGRLAVLGPVRMEYRHIIPALEYISDALSEALERI